MTDVELLKAYRDTGLEPEEVKALKSYADRKAVMMVTEIDGVPIERVLELTQADKDGRLLVLPDVAQKDREAFRDGLHDYFTEASLYDPSVGIYGMTDGEVALANALMAALKGE